jgi:uncharacterized protein YecE (DUF72 family)
LSLIRVGTAGWAIPRAIAGSFPEEGSGLQRYAARFGVAEINSSFHRPHRPGTYLRWAEAVPEDFRFAAKLPRRITHDLRLVGAEEELQRFLGEVAGLGSRLGPLLVQLPPSLAFEAAPAATFFRQLRSRHAGGVALEPRHASWFAPEPDGLLREHRIARVAADPARVPAASEPGGWAGLAYVRLHGSPRTYYSSYQADYLEALAARLRDASVETWCIFDNTASGAAAANALDLLTRLGGGGP